ncbi:ParB/RepB/Spo0J family partition protein [Bradyrhizobium erythrophlei]|uniref:ParB/RepB/Spo0J family partition protein n=1 Tax=Bradyrhizobium erythrophlei TaxID=1437360 RepID=A0A1M5JTD3_9BRAD|nr:ParB N-terminal domain-containing protein [Bradyrhizobium erythrophlei]SHG43788.1 ParB/RepB/Spo0J family partition protein [Bradyrhizobium erythrophlei]
MTLKLNSSDDWNDGEPVEDGSNESRRLPKPKVPIDIEIKNIVLGKRGRAIDHLKVSQFERSIADQGFLQPIHVYALKNSLKGKYGLAAGQHRLRALINLGFQNVSAVVISRRQAKAWQPAENLYRKEVRGLQRSEDIVKYAANRQNLPAVEVTRAGGKQPHDRGYKKLAEVTGLDRKRIAEAFLHVQLPAAVKKLVLSLPKLNNRRILNALAKMDNQRAQIAFIRERSKVPSANECRTGMRAALKRQKQDTKRRLDGSESLEAAWKASEVREIFEWQIESVKIAFIEKWLRNK